MKTAWISALLLTVMPLAALPAAEPPVGRFEQNEVIQAGHALLAAATDFRPDGSARSTHQLGDFSSRIELQGLEIRNITRLPLTGADAGRGVTRRYHARIACRAHRIWDGPQVAWSEWRDSPYGFFPTTIVIEEIQGELVASAGRIGDFSPGIDGAFNASRR